MADVPSIFEQAFLPEPPQQEPVEVVRLRGEMSTGLAQLKGEMNTKFATLDASVEKSREVLSSKLDNMRWTLTVVASVVGVAIVVVLGVLRLAGS